MELNARVHKILNDIKGEISFKAVLSRGPGGQNVNKVSNGAVLFWNFQKSQYLTETEKTTILSKNKNKLNRDGFLSIKSDASRELERNKLSCIKKLEELLLMSLYVQPKRTPTKPTWSSKQKNLKSKKARGDIKKMRSKVNYD